MKDSLYKTSFYNTWDNMKRRSTNPKNRDYWRYGKVGRGMYDKWADFQEFKKDMYASYLDAQKTYNQDKLSLDRIDNNKGYYPDNCRWATPAMQTRNTSRNWWITINGEKNILTDWARIYNICWVTAKSRLLRGWDAEKAFSTPPTSVNQYTCSRTLPVGIYRRDSGRYEVKYKSKNYGTYNTIKEAQQKRQAVTRG